jgi:hypothetical protein
VSPKEGTTLPGSTLTVTVSVSNFKLVPPVYINPPKLSGNQGHIHYVLDNLANFVARRDARASLSHAWSNVAPGRHTIIVYLATSQHAQFPGTQRATVQVTVARQPAKAATTPSEPTSAPAPRPAAKQLATTGGAAGMGEDQLPDFSPVLGFLFLVLGLSLLGLGRRSA